ncbi:MAG: hypothetical protein ABI333_17135 [bacterium]
MIAVLAVGVSAAGVSAAGVSVAGVSVMAGSVAHAAPAAPAAPAATVKKSADKGWSSVEVGFQGTVIGDKGKIGLTYLGPVFTLQGGNIPYLAGVFQFGVGAALYGDDIPDPADPTAGGRGVSEVFYLGLGARLRLLKFFGQAGDKPYDLYLGPLAMVFGNRDLVTLSAAGELGFGLSFGRVRLSLTVHAGYVHIMHQFANDPEHLKAKWSVGGQLSVGAQF